MKINTEIWFIQSFPIFPLFNTNTKIKPTFVGFIKPTFVGLIKPTFVGLISRIFSTTISQSTTIMIKTQHDKPTGQQLKLTMTSRQEQATNTTKKNKTSRFTDDND